MTAPSGNEPTQSTGDTARGDETRPEPASKSDQPTEDLGTTMEMPAERQQWPSGPEFGHYRIVSELGKGAMGVVYLACDKLLFDVRRALKILPAECTREVWRLQQFEREARAASALNHPNILTVHEVGEANGTHFIATEFVDGCNLRRLMVSDRMAPLEVIKIAEQIAAALDVTHRAGIVHRDIKPENVMVRPDGLVKVVDFGLARLMSGRTPSGTQRAVALSDIETEAGIRRGTPRYMSPEQVQAQNIDARTDIYSLGVLLYEMLAGKAPFPSEKLDDLFWQIRNKEPEPLGTHVAGLPAELEGVVSKALAKDRRQRYQTAGELLLDLKAARSKLESPVAENGISKKLLAAIASVIVIIGLVLWTVIPRSNPSPTPTAPHIRFLENLPIKDGRASFSPDGHQIAFSSGAEGEQNIWIRNLEGAEARPLTNGKFSDRYPVWSPDGQQLAFVSDRGGTNAIWLVSSLGGRPARLLVIEGADVILIGWSKKHQRLYAEIRPNLFAVTLSPPGLIQLTNFDASRLKARNFSVSPQEDFVAYSALMDQKTRCIVKAPIGRDEAQQVTQGEGGEDRSPSWLPDGKEFIYNSRRGDVYQLFRARIDGGRSVPIAVSDNDYDSLVVSPDGASIITVSRKEKGNIFCYDRKSRKETQLTSDFALQLYPDVSRDGERFLFHSSNTSAKLEGSIMVGFTHGGNQPAQTVSGGIEAKWAPDGKTLAIVREAATSIELWKVSAVEKNETRLTTRLLLSGRTPIPYSFFATNFSWAPDGDRIAYASAESGRRNLRVVSSDGSSDTVLTNSNDDKVKLTSPIWSHDGNRLAFVSEPLSYTAAGKRDVCLIEGGKTRTLFTYATQFRLLGWTKSDKEVCVAVGGGDASDTQDIKLYRIPAAGGPPVTIAEMAGVFLHSIKLSEDGLSLAVVSRQDGKDNIEVVSSLGGPVTKLTNNSDATARYSGLTWSSDGKILFYSKQTSWSVASLIRNFK